VVAVNVTGCPTNDGDPDVVTIVVVATGSVLIYSFNVEEVLPALCRSPEYLAVIRRVDSFEYDKL
jgi:hypothetical protein